MALTSKSARRAGLVGALSALVVSFALTTSSFAHAEGSGVRVGVIDVQRAVAQTEDGLRAQATLKKLFESRQQQLDAKQKDLQRQKEEIDKQSRVLSKEALQKRVDDWQKQMMDLQQIFLEYNKELEKKQKELTDPVIEKVMVIIKRIATTENIDIVIDKNTTAYVRTELDLTDRAIQAYNSGGGGAGPAAPAPAPKK
jgi:outer membrane protein